MEVKVTVPDDEIGTISKNEIIAAIATQVAATHLGDDTLRKFLHDSIKKRVGEWVEETLGSSFSKMTFPQTNRYGEPTGKTQTCREFLATVFEKVLTTQVNDNGKSDSYGSKVGTFAEYIVTKAIQDEIRHKADEALKGLLPKASDVLADAVRKALDYKLGVRR